MKSTLFTYLLIGLLLLLNGAVHAEGGCPPGMAPTNGTDISSCVPLPPGYYANQQQAPSSADHWGAMAIDSNTGAFGTVSNNTLGRGIAQLVSMATCQSKGGTKCRIAAVYHDSCAAMAASQTTLIAATGASLNKAINKAMRRCSATGDSSCCVSYSDCSRAGYIQ